MKLGQESSEPVCVSELSRCRRHTLKRIYNFFYELQLFKGSMEALRVMCDHHCAPARTPGLWKGQLALSDGI